MYVGKVNIPYNSASDYIELIPFSDLHFGNKLCDWNTFKNYTKLLDNENVYWMCLGDMLDSIIVSDPRFDTKSCGIGDMVLDYADKIVDVLQPYTDTCIGYLTGNHEEKLRKKVQIDISRYIAKQLGVTYMGYNSLLYLSFNRKHHNSSMVLFATHGYFNGQSRSGRIRRVEDLCEYFDADIYLFAHTHDLMSTKTTVYSVNRSGQLIQKEKVFILTGGYLKGYSTSVDEYNYVETKLLKPTQIGSPIVRIYPEYKHVRCDVDGFGILQKGRK